MALALWTVYGLYVLILALAPPPPGADSSPTVHLCGSHLVDVLYLVCGDRGFFYNPNRSVSKRDLQPAIGFLLKRAQEDRPRLWKGSSSGPRGREEQKVKRGIVEQCCHKPCSIYDLGGYCN